MPLIALIALLNAPFQWLGTHAWGTDPGSSLNAWMSAQLGHPVELSLQTLFGWILAPVAWVIGVPWQDATLVGSFIGQKVVINEFVAYVDMAKNLGQLSEHSQLISTYALCGLPTSPRSQSRSAVLAVWHRAAAQTLPSWAWKAVLGGSLATFMTATIAGL